MKLAGIVFILFSAGSVGYGVAAALKKRCRMLNQLLSALQLLSGEIGCCGTPLPQAFALMAVSAQGAPERIFSYVAKAMDQKRWITPQMAMRRALEQEPELPPDDPVVDILLELSAELGKYDRESQLAVLEKSRVRLEQLLQAVEQECSTRGKTYRVLGICTGISLAILLM